MNVPESRRCVLCFPDVSSYFGKTLKGQLIKDATEFSMFLLAEANVATVTGDALEIQIVFVSLTQQANALLTETMRRIKAVS